MARQRKSPKMGSVLPAQNLLPLDSNMPTFSFHRELSPFRSFSLTVEGAAPPAAQSRGSTSLRTSISSQATSSALTVPSKRNEVWHRIDDKNCFLLLQSRPIRPSPWQKLNSTKLHGRSSALATSCVNAVLQGKVVLPQWDSRARPAKRQHRPDAVWVELRKERRPRVLKEIADHFRS
jgi:hypothetical protein